MTSTLEGDRARLAIITGAARGIGLATSVAFHELGYACLALDRDRDGLAELQQRLGRGEPGRFTAVCVDLVAGDLGPLSRALDGFDQHSLHLVNNVGGSLHARRGFELLSWDDFEAALRFNLKATLRTTQAVLPRMRRERRGWVVNVGSVAARRALDYVGADYAAAKGALLTLTRTLAHEVAADGILVNSVCPGIVASERILQRWAARSSADNDAILSSIALSRLGTPEQIARACVFLGSSSNQYITGAVLDVNGGACFA
jgi:NAD(P)-dependent dehydrogenase (short-subunit alcohol dehydrogenase family)